MNRMETCENRLPSFTSFFFFFLEFAWYRPEKRSVHLQLVNITGIRIQMSQSDLCSFLPINTTMLLCCTRHHFDLPHGHFCGGVQYHKHLIYGFDPHQRRRGDCFTVSITMHSIFGVEFGKIGIETIRNMNLIY